MDSKFKRSEISVPFPQDDDLSLTIAIGACRLRILPGDGDAWVQGTFEGPEDSHAPRVVTDEGSVRITHDVSLGSWMWKGEPPTFTLHLGKAHPYNFAIETGASETTVDLGGLPLKRLTVKQGAGKIGVDFSSPLASELSVFAVQAGVGGIELSNLANARFAEMTVEGGAAQYTLDFGGTLSRDANVQMSVGMAGVEVLIPESTPARVKTEVTLGNANPGDGFTKRGGAWLNQAAVDGKTPTLSINLKAAMSGIAIKLK